MINQPVQDATNYNGIIMAGMIFLLIGSVKQIIKTIDIGYYDTLEEAQIARQNKANELFGVFTNRIERIKTELELLEEEFEALINA